MHRNGYFMVLLAAGAVGASLFSGPRSVSPGTAAISDTLTVREEVFASPIPVEWSGGVYGAMESGGAYAIAGTDGAPESFYASFGQAPEQPLDGFVRLRGLHTGTTCAYQNTVFSGRCVPELLIREVLP